MSYAKFCLLIKYKERWMDGRDGGQQLQDLLRLMHLALCATRTLVGLITYARKIMGVFFPHIQNEIMIHRHRKQMVTKGGRI